MKTTYPYHTFYLLLVSFYRRHCPVPLKEKEKTKQTKKEASFRIGHTWIQIYICFYVYRMVITTHETLLNCKYAGIDGSLKAKENRRGFLPFFGFFPIFAFAILTLPAYFHFFFNVLSHIKQKNGRGGTRMICTLDIRRLTDGRCQQDKTFKKEARFLNLWCTYAYMCMLP